MPVSDVFLNAEFKYVSRISLSPTPSAVHQTMWKHKLTYVSHWGGGLKEVVWTCNKHSHVSYTCGRLPVAGQSLVCYRPRSAHFCFTMPRKCVNSSEAFWYICGEVTFKSRRQSFTPLIKKCHEHYFGCKVGDQDKSWVAHFCCVICAKLFHAVCLSSFLWFWESPRTMFHIATSAWPVSLV